jgi:hypothetical protein
MKRAASVGLVFEPTLLSYRPTLDVPGSSEPVCPQARIQHEERLLTGGRLKQPLIATKADAKVITGRVL